MTSIPHTAERLPDGSESSERLRLAGWLEFGCAHPEKLDMNAVRDAAIELRRLSAPAVEPVAVMEAPKAIVWRIGGRYNWRNQPERLVYLGRNWSGNGFWHQFEKVEEPGRVWCEVLDADLSSFEETPSASPAEQAATQAEAKWRTSWAVLQRLRDVAKEPPTRHPNANREPGDIWRTVLLSDLQELLKHAAPTAPTGAQADSALPLVADTLADADKQTIIQALWCADMNYESERFAELARSLASPARAIPEQSEHLAKGTQGAAVSVLDTDAYVAERVRAEQEQHRGEIAYQLTKRLVIDMPTARAAVDAAIAAINAQGEGNG
jgi:hypothetical protein